VIPQGRRNGDITSVRHGTGDYMIEVKDLTKKYGEMVVLDGINVRFENGKIYGLIGRNGSGKTMLMKCIMGFVLPQFGSVTVDGKVIGKDLDIPESIGAIIENPGFLLDYSAFQNLKYLAMIQNKISDEEIKAALTTVGLDAGDRKKVRKFSMGMRQRLGLAQALMEKPQILLLDEPMNGLDDRGVEDMRKVILAYRSPERVIIMASHSKEDIELLCDEVFLMNQGRLLKNANCRDQGTFAR